MIEEIIYTPMFLPNVGAMLIHRKVFELAGLSEVENGDAIVVKELGITKDSDGWPMKRWSIQVRKAH